MHRRDFDFLHGFSILANSTDALLVGIETGKIFHLAPPLGSPRATAGEPPVRRAVALAAGLVRRVTTSALRRGSPFAVGSAHVLTYGGTIECRAAILRLDAAVTTTRYGETLLVGGPGSGKTTLLGVFQELSGGEGGRDSPYTVAQELAQPPSVIWLLDGQRRRGSQFVLARLPPVIAAMRLLLNMRCKDSDVARLDAVHFAARLSALPAVEVTLPSTLECLRTGAADFAYAPTPPDDPQGTP